MIGSSGAYIAFIVPVSGVLCYVNFVGTTGSDLMYLGAPDSTGTTQITVLGKVASNLGTGTSEVRMMDTTVLGAVTHSSTAAAGGDLFVVDDSFIQ